MLENTMIQLAQSSQSQDQVESAYEAGIIMVGLAFIQSIQCTLKFTSEEYRSMVIESFEIDCDDTLYHISITREQDVYVVFRAHLNTVLLRRISVKTDGDDQPFSLVSWCRKIEITT
jgi:hypothetical protein